MNEPLIRRSKYWLFRVLLWKLASGCYMCANRYRKTFKFGIEEVTVIFRNTNLPDAYSREEVYEMLKTVREEEKRMGWKCPEPEVENE